MSQAPAIELKKLQMEYVKGSPVLDIDRLRIPRGQVVGLIGPNGAGKTTLFHAVSGDLRDDRLTGEILLHGTNASRWSGAKCAQYGVRKLFQDARVFQRLTVKENLLAAIYTRRDRAWFRALWPGGNMKRKHKDEVRDVLDDLGYPGFHQQLNRLAGDLPFGEQKLLAFARLIALHRREPDPRAIFLLDEPMAGVFATNASYIAKAIRQLATLGVTILMIEHEMEHIEALCSHALVLNQGGIYPTVPNGPEQEPQPMASVLGNEKVRDLCAGLILNH